MKRIMKLLLVTMIVCCISCQKTFQSKSESVSNISSKTTNSIIHQIEKDLKEKKIWADTIVKITSSDCIYEVRTGGGMYLYSASNNTCEMLDYEGISWQKDFIECSDTTGIEYEWKGCYNIISDSIISIEANEYYRLLIMDKDHEYKDSIFQLRTYKYEYALRQYHFVKLSGDTIVSSYDVGVSEDCIETIENLHLID